MMILLSAIGVAGFASIAVFCMNLFKEEDRIEQHARS